MTLSGNTPLGDMVTAHPNATRVLLRYNLDFCCGGKQSLAQACKKKDLDLDAILGELTTAIDPNNTTRWDLATAEELIQHLLDVYHAPLREDLDQIQAMAQKVLRVHGEKDPERLKRLEHTVTELKNDLIPHLMKEENILFPWILAGREPSPTGPIRVMRMDHDTAGVMLETIGELTNRFQPPEIACATWRNLYKRLEILDSDLRHHIHLENNVLFPKVLG